MVALANSHLTIPEVWTRLEPGTDIRIDKKHDSRRLCPANHDEFVLGGIRELAEAVKNRPRDESFSYVVELVFWGERITQTHVGRRLSMQVFKEAGAIRQCGDDLFQLDHVVFISRIPCRIVAEVRQRLKAKVAISLNRLVQAL